MSRTAMLVMLVAAAAAATGWVRTHDGGFGADQTNAITLTSAGIPYAVGSVTGSDGSSDLVLVGYDPTSGDSTVATWHYLLGSDFDEEGLALATGTGGYVFVTGYSTDSIRDDGDLYYFGQVTTLKYSGSLTLQWADHVPPGSNAAKVEEMEPSGQAVVTLGTKAFVAAEGFDNDDDGYDVLSSCHDGTTHEQQWFGGDWEGDDAGNAVAVDAQGNCYVAGGCTETGARQSDFLVLKYDIDFDLEWEAWYDGPASGIDEASAIVPGSGGRVFVTGASADANGLPDFATVCYDSTGQQLWVARCATDSADVPAAMGANQQGCVFVTGTSKSANSGHDFLTIRYNPVTGETVWTRRYDDSGLDDVAAAIAVDFEGSVYVAGYASRADSGRDVCVVKYSMGGTQLKTWYWDDASGGDDAATGIAVDSDKNLYVTGYGQGVHDDDIVTMRIEQPAYYDIGISAILAPGDTADYGQQVVPAAVVFAGDTTHLEDSIPVTMRIGDDYICTRNALPAAGESQIVVFDPWAVQQTGYIYAVCSLTVVDSNPANDRAERLVTIPAGWNEMAEMPVDPQGPDKTVKAGGWVAYNPGDGLVYAAKGNNTTEFYAYHPDLNLWSGQEPLPSLTPIPTDEHGHAKKPKAGCRGVADGGNCVYVTKGHNSQGFWRYDIAEDSWTHLPDVPLGLTGKKVKGGADLAYVEVNDTGYVYLLKGCKCEFWRFSTAAGSWESLADAPIGTKGSWKEGSWLCYDGDSAIYAHKAWRYVGDEHEFWRYDIPSNSWCVTRLHGMPRYGLHGGSVKRKKAKDGGAGTYYNGLIYAQKGGNTQQFFLYVVAADTWTETDTIPTNGSTGKKKRASKGGDLVCAGDVFYALKGNNTREFWRYIPGQPEASFATRAGSKPGAKVAGGGKDDEQAIAEGYDAHRPQWHNSGQFIVYTREDDDGVEQVYVSDAAGQNEWQQTFGEGSCENPVWSPNVNEKVIAFQTEDTATGFWQIAVVEFDTSGQDAAPTVAPVEPLPVSAPVALSPVSQALPEAVAPVLAKRIEGPKTIAARPSVAAPSSPGLDAEPQVLTSSDEDHYSPSWSPDQAWLVYVADDEATGYSQLRRIPAGGGTEQQLSWDESDHEDPQYLDERFVVYTKSVYGEYDQICRFDLWYSQEEELTDEEADHGHPAPSANGYNVVFEVEDADGMTQVGRVCASGGDEDCLTEEDIDLETPTWSPDNQTVFCVGWRYPGTEIGLVTTTGYEAVTDSEVIRLNPDVFYNGLNSQQLIVFERETWDTSGMDGNGRPGPRPRRPGRGIFLIRVSRRPGDGVQTGEAFKLALERIRPNPAAGQLSLRWQVPGRDRVTVQAFDVTGRVVRTLCDEELAPGVYDCRWDCTDEVGRKLPAGVYFFSLSSAGKELKQKVVLQR